MSEIVAIHGRDRTPTVFILDDILSQIERKGSFTLYCRYQPTKTRFLQVFKRKLEKAGITIEEKGNLTLILKRSRQ